MSNDAFKAAAAEHALEYVENGMRLGLGTGSTAAGSGAEAYLCMVPGLHD